MSAVAVVSAKGSPGVTTTALAFTAVASSPLHAASFAPSVLVEADAAGGDLECWCGPLGRAGLAGVAASNREATYERLGAHSIEVVPGVRAVVAPTTAAPMMTILRSGTAPLVDAMARWPGTVFVDAGRCDAASELSTGALLEALSLVVVVCRPTLASVEHTRDLVTRWEGSGPDMAAVVVGGDWPYRAADIGAALGIGVLGVLPWDPRGVSGLVERGVTKAWLRSPLAKSAAGCLSELVRVAEVAVGPPRRSMSRPEPEDRTDQVPGLTRGRVDVTG